jgi:hypothetical protein
MYDCYQAIKKNPSDSCIMTLFRYSIFFPDLINTDRTLQQLKNAGGLRLIPAEAADSIAEYDKLIRLYVKQESTSYQEVQTAIRNTIYSFNKFGGTGGAPIRVSTDSNLLNQYFNQLYFYTLASSTNITDLRKIKIRAKGLISFFAGKYHLE